MDSFEFNKMAGALLGTVLVVFVVNLFADEVFAPEKPEKPGYVVEVEEPETTTETKAAKPKVDIAVLLAKADPARGEKLHARCTGCHSFNEGGKTVVGPNLWGIVNRPMGGEEGFKYSKGMVATRDGKTWTYEHLNTFLTKPSAFIPNTTMNFPGFKKPQDRANVIAFLRTLSKNPAPLPEPKAADTAGTGTEKTGGEKTGTEKKASE